MLISLTSAGATDSIDLGFVIELVLLSRESIDKLLPDVEAGKADSSAFSVSVGGIGAAFAGLLAYLLLFRFFILYSVRKDTVGVDASFELISFVFEADVDNEVAVDPASELLLLPSQALNEFLGLTIAVVTKSGTSLVFEEAVVTYAGPEEVGLLVTIPLGSAFGVVWIGCLDTGGVATPILYWASETIDAAATGVGKGADVVESNPNFSAQCLISGCAFATLFA